MKKIVQLLAVIFAFSFNLNGQEYYPFPTENVFWNVYLEFSLYESPADTFLLRYTLRGDTAINQVTYKKLCIESGDTINPIIKPIGGLREEEKQIFFVGDDYLGYTHEEELLLYDFSKGIGDTIFHDNYDTFYSVVENIDTVDISGENRRRFKIKTCNNYYFEDEEYWIEGIGSIKNSLLGHITMIPTCCYQYWEHVCFRVIGGIEYLNPSFDECFPSCFFSSIVPLINGSEIRVYPNPSSDRLIIENNSTEKELIVKIYDLN
jgi:hypothetical protein